MERWTNKVALVTGASSGIGAMICNDLVNYGMTVIGAARRLDRLEELENNLKGSNGKFIPYKCDVTKENQICILFQYIEKTFKRLDVCINNAGRNDHLTLMEGSAETWKELLNLNVVSLTSCTQYAINSMRSHDIDDGHIINISSILGTQVFPFARYHFYSATKFAVRAITQGFRQELKDMDSGIRISSISPGAVATEFYAHAVQDERSKARQAKLVPLMPKDISEIVISVLSMPGHAEVNDIVVTPTRDVISS